MSNTPHFRHGRALRVLATLALTSLLTLPSFTEARATKFVSGNFYYETLKIQYRSAISSIERL